MPLDVSELLSQKAGQIHIDVEKKILRSVRLYIYIWTTIKGILGSGLKNWMVHICCPRFDSSGTQRKTGELSLGFVAQLLLKKTFCTPIMQLCVKHLP